MKDIRIFVASSKELERERNELAYLMLAKEEEFAARGLRVRLAKWEYVDLRMTEARTEDRYLDEMYDCDAAFVLFRDIAGFSLLKCTQSFQENLGFLPLARLKFPQSCFYDGKAMGVPCAIMRPVNDGKHENEHDV